MSNEEALQGETKLSSKEVVALKAQFLGEDRELNQLAFDVCALIAEDMADHTENLTGSRPGHEDEWKTANAAMRGLALQYAIALPDSEWPEGFPAPEVYAAALNKLEEQ